ncbi:MAG TPA: nuclear transport factor 2 family protein [Solirubrobacterales bacterium]|jgi:ketosteroid isomerase-like protein|nr:nuclear transport factor 2 family protein [Solirubrobacterales bacterium]
MGERELHVVEQLQAALPREDVVAGLLDPETQLKVADALSRFATPDFEVRMVGPERLGANSFVGEGATGFTAVWGEWTSAFQSFRIEIDETIDAGEVILSLVRISGRTRTDGVAVEQSGAAIWTVRDDKVIRAEFHLDRAGAIKAAGLSEGAGG